MTMNAQIMLSGMFGGYSASDVPCPMSHKKYLARDEKRLELTREGLVRPLTSVETSVLQLAQHDCVSYLRWMFGPDRPNTKFVANRLSYSAKQAARTAGRFGKLMFRK